MSRLKPFLALVLCAMMSSPVFGQTDSFTEPGKRGFIQWFARPYAPHAVTHINFADSDRIDKLMRAGNIYLSLRDAIALALENNLDIEVARLQPKLNLTNLQASFRRPVAAQSVDQHHVRAQFGVVGRFGI